MLDQLWYDESAFSWKVNLWSERGHDEGRDVEISDEMEAKLDKACGYECTARGGSVIEVGKVIWGPD